MTKFLASIKSMGLIVAAVAGGLLVFFFRDSAIAVFGAFKNKKQQRTIKDYWHERDKNLDLHNKVIDDKYSTGSTESLLRPDKGEYIKPKS